jgi:hypothetical protein
MKVTDSRKPVKKRSVEKMNFIREIMSDTSVSSEDDITFFTKNINP